MSLYRCTMKYHPDIHMEGLRKNITKFLNQDSRSRSQDLKPRIPENTGHLLLRFVTACKHTQGQNGKRQPFVMLDNDERGLILLDNLKIWKLKRVEV
jgi:hypothetical protein